MNETEDNNNSQPAMAEKKAQGKQGFSPIWIVPIVALLIGAFLLYRVVAETGPTITISFKHASGLAAGKTEIKYKGVTVGEVTSVDLSGDISTVIITADMLPKSNEFLTDKTRFWVAKPQFSGGTITGLSTLLSGHYISIDPSTEGTMTKTFVGLERPPVIHLSADGSYFNLRATRLGGINFGSPVYYKDIPVGQLVDYNLKDDGSLKLEIFIKAPYDRHVNSASRFWNAAGFDVTVSADGLEINTESLIAIIGGGIAFDTVAGLGEDASEPPAADHVFSLAKSRSKARKLSYTNKERLLLHFDDSVRGLIPGAPVEMSGFKIGEVVDVGLEFNRDTNEIRLPVLIEIEPKRIEMSGELDFERTINALVKKGMRGQLKTGNLVLGKLLVTLDFHPDAAPATADFSGKTPVLPTIKGAFAAIVENAGTLIAELRQTGESINTLLQSEDTRQSLKDLAVTIANVKRLTAELEKTTVPELGTVLTRASATLEEAHSMLATNSTTRTEIDRMLAELGQAARSIRLLADYLEQHPESIIEGKD